MTCVCRLLTTCLLVEVRAFVQKWVRYPHIVIVDRAGAHRAPAAAHILETVLTSDGRTVIVDHGCSFWNAFVPCQRAARSEARQRGGALQPCQECGTPSDTVNTFLAACLVTWRSTADRG